MSFTGRSPGERLRSRLHPAAEWQKVINARFADLTIDSLNAGSTFRLCL
jgi:hypothetical protein